MKLFIVFLFLFLLGSLLLPAQDLTQQDFFDLMVRSEKERETFMDGFLLGVYYASLLANWEYGLEKDHALQIMILDETATDLIREVLDWYRRTQAWDAPLYVAVYRRRLD